MGLLSKWLGIDARRNAQDAAKRAAEQEAKDRAAAQAQADATAAQQKQYQDALLNIQKESGVLNAANKELSTDTVSNVVAGGSADAADPTLKKKKLGGGIAQSLGINV